VVQTAESSPSALIVTIALSRTSTLSLTLYLCLTRLIVSIALTLTVTITVTVTVTLTLILYSYVRDDVHEGDILHHHLPHSHGEGGSQAECHLTEHSGQQKHLRVRRRQK
jgi:hypothetical protein